MFATVLNRVGAVDEQMLEGKASRQVIAQRLYAVTFGGVVACGVEVHAHLAGGVDGLLGGFAGDEGIDACSAAWLM